MIDGPQCIVCAGHELSTLLRVNRVPVVSNELCATRHAALNASTGAITLVFCNTCGHIFNIEFDAQLVRYGLSYENSLQCSGRFREYEDELVNSLIERYRLHGKTIVEIGCGNGDFLMALCSRGSNRGIGFDPAYRPAANVNDSDSRVFICRERYGEGRELRGELVCSRQTLEHIARPREFLANVRDAITAKGVPVFFEVPNAMYTVRDGGIWDLIYEHPSYFSSGSLARLFFESGFRPDEVVETYDGQFLTIHARTDKASSSGAPRVSAELCSAVAGFAESYHRKVNDWHLLLQELRDARQKIVIWGAGAKGTTFLNALRPVNVEYVVDLNPRKQGNYVPGTGQEIVAPQHLAEYRPDVVIVMNAIYRNEIVQTTSELGLEPEFLYA